MLDQFMVQQNTASAPWAPKVKVPLVSVIQMPDNNLVVPSVTESGVVLSESKGDLHDVQEMDSSFILALNLVFFWLLVPLSAQFPTLL